MAKQKANYDWEAIEREYRAGQLSVRQISRSYGTPETSIRAKVQKRNWQRDLTEHVQREVKNRIHSSEDEQPTQAPQSEALTPEEQEIVHNSASRGVEIVRQHQERMRRLNQLLDYQMRQVEKAQNGEDMEGHEVKVWDKKEKKWVASSRIIGLGDRESLTDILQKIGQTLSKITPLERQAFSVDDAERKADLHVIELD